MKKTWSAAMPYRSLQDLVRAEHEDKDQSGSA